MPKCVVVNPYFDWADVHSPRRPYHETVIYEAHVKGLTATHPGVPAELRGTYAGLAHPAMLDHYESWASRRSSSCPCTISSTTTGWSSEV